MDFLLVKLVYYKKEGISAMEIMLLFICNHYKLEGLNQNALFFVKHKFDQ